MKLNKLLIAVSIATFALASCESEFTKDAELNVNVATGDGVSFDGQTITVKRRVCQNRHILFSYQIQFGSLSMQPFPASAILKTPNSSHKLFLSVCFPYKFGQGVA